MSKTTNEGGDGAATISKADHDAAVAKAELSGLAAGIADKDAAVAKARAEGKAEGLTDGAKAERERIIGIDAIAVAGHDELITAAKADGKTTPEQVAMQILKAEQATRGKQMAAIKSVETEGGKVAAAPNPAGSPAAAKVVAIDATGWKAEYEAPDANGIALRAEFPTGVESYVAFRKAEASGLVRRLVNRTA